MELEKKIESTPNIIKEEKSGASSTLNQDPPSSTPHETSSYVSIHLQKRCVSFKISMVHVMWHFLVVNHRDLKKLSKMKAG